MSTTSFIYRVESDAKLLAAVRRMYAEVMADSPAVPPASSWRDQVRYLLQQYGRDVVIESLMESVEGLSLRHAVTLADLAERPPSGRMQTV